MLYTNIFNLPYEYKDIYLSKYKKLDIIIQYITLKEGISNVSNLESYIFLKYLKDAIRKMEKANKQDNLSELIKKYKKKINKYVIALQFTKPLLVSNSNIVFSPNSPNNNKNNNNIFLTSNFPPSGFPPSGFPPSGFPPSGFPPNNFPPNSFPPNSFPPNSFPPNNIIPPNNEKIGLAIGFSLRDQYISLLNMINSTILLPQNSRFFHVIGEKTIDTLTFTDLVNCLKYIQENYSNDASFSAKQSMIFTVMEQYTNLLNSLQKYTKQNYDTPYIPIKTLLSDSIRFDKYELSEKPIY